MSSSYPLAEYERFQHTVLAEIRTEAFGEDIGQFSWITADEFRKFLGWLEVSGPSTLLDIACGSGGLSLYAAEQTGCQIIGLDLSPEAIQTAKETAAKRGLQERAEFRQFDARTPLPLEDRSVDAIVCIDALNHFFHKEAVFAEWRRVLRPGGRFVFTDACIVAGPLSRDELLARSKGMGDFFFTPIGFYETAIAAAGFVEVLSEDVTETIALTARRWWEARSERKDDLLRIESAEKYKEMQEVLQMAAQLPQERRLLRIAFRATAPA